MKNSLLSDYVMDLSKRAKPIAKHENLFDYNKDFANLFLVFLNGRGIIGAGFRVVSSAGRAVGF